MCSFQSLYYSDAGYVVHCKKCDLYQVGFISTMLSLAPKDFNILCKLVKYKYHEETYCCNENSKSVIIPTPAEGIFMLLTKRETKLFGDILDHAESEATALSLIDLFKGQ